MQVTASQPDWASQFQAIQPSSSPMSRAAEDGARSGSTPKTCGKSYFGNNIVFEPMFNLARLDSDPGRQATIQGILQSNMWNKGVVNDKNPWFAYMYARPGGLTTQAPPRQWPWPTCNCLSSSLRLAYTSQSPTTCFRIRHCAGNALTAIDITDRVIGDFQWQRQPWQESDPGLPNRVSGMWTILAAYWRGASPGIPRERRPDGMHAVGSLTVR